MSLSDIPRVLRDYVFDRDDGRCQDCSLSQVGQAAVFHINHVVPRSRGGPTAAENLVLLCPCCSLRKSNKVAAPDPQTGDVVGLFHPRRQDWSEHFYLDPDGPCRGRTPTGRATVAALAMNEPIPTTARGIQVMLGLI